MRKSKKLFFVFFVLLIGMGLTISGYAAKEKVTPSTKLILSTEYNKNDMRGEVAAYWASLVEKKTNGKVKVEIHYSGELISGKDTYGATASGAVDVSLLSSSYFTGEVPAVELFILPLPPPEVTLDNYWDAWRNNRDFFSSKIEKQGCKTLMVFPMGTFTQIFSRVPIHNAADLKGKKIRVAGGKVLPYSAQGLVRCRQASLPLRSIQPFRMALWMPPSRLTKPT
jgi:TRAP-type C4-dicarboxylate transport system substrate-binding protein